MTSVKSKVNYDQIASRYNQRYQENRLEGVKNALTQLARAINARAILEVGCGTGHWLTGLLTAIPKGEYFGLDYSMGMLVEAQKKSVAFKLVRGKGGRLPLKTECFDLVFCVNALHHFNEPTSFVEQAWQLLRPGGILAVIGQVPHDRRNRWFVYDYFEGVYQFDLQRFPSWGEVLDWMISAGFQQILWEPVEWISDDKVGWAVLDDPFLQKHATSQLALLSEAAYAQGIEKIKTALRQADTTGKTLTFKSQLRLDLIAGTKPQEASS